MTKKHAAANFARKDVVIGSDIDAVKFAHDNKFFLIKNREPYHHSYEDIEEAWAIMLYELYNEGLVPFVDKCCNIRVNAEDKIVKVITERNTYIIKYDKLHMYDDINVEGLKLGRKLAYYRVIDWFDCQGLSDLDFSEIVIEDKFVNKIKLFKTQRIDGDQKYLDLLCESFLSEDQLKNFDYSDTMARFKVVDLLKQHGVESPKVSLWKRDIHPIYK